MYPPAAVRAAAALAGGRAALPVLVGHGGGRRAPRVDGRCSRWRLAMAIVVFDLVLAFGDDFVSIHAPSARQHSSTRTSWVLYACGRALFPFVLSGRFPRCDRTAGTSMVAPLYSSRYSRGMLDLSPPVYGADLSSFTPMNERPRASKTISPCPRQPAKPAAGVPAPFCCRTFLPVFAVLPHVFLLHPPFVGSACASLSARAARAARRFHISSSSSRLP